MLVHQESLEAEADDREIHGLGGRGGLGLDLGNFLCSKEKDKVDLVTVGRDSKEDAKINPLPSIFLPPPLPPLSLSLPLQPSIPSVKPFSKSPSRFSNSALFRSFRACRRRRVSTSGTFFLVTCKMPILGNLWEWQGQSWLGHGNVQATILL